MKSISLYDNIAAMQAKALPIQLHGHAKFTLRDALTDKVTDVIESDNLVTHAVDSILANNFAGMANYSSSNVQPLKKMFNGVLLFKDQLTENADAFNIPAESANICYGWAGSETHQTASPYRGTPNAGASDSGADYDKFVWDWAPEQGNGNINACCLCPGFMGNMGTKPFDNTLNAFQDLTIGSYRSSATSNFTSGNYFKYPVTINEDGITGLAIWADGTTFTEANVWHNFHKLTIMRGPDDWEVESTRTATIRTVVNTKSFVFQDSDYYYVGLMTGAGSVQLDKINKTDMTVTTADISNISGVTLGYTLSMRCGVNKCQPVFPYDGKYLYLPNANNTSAYGINISNPADVVELSGTVSSAFRAAFSDLRVAKYVPVVISQGLIWMGDSIINSDTIYPIAQPVYLNGTENEDVIYTTLRRGAGLCTLPRKIRYDGSFGPGVGLLGMFLSTINNLQSPVPKTNSRYMRLEYTLTLV